jgi:hypothetical protein
MTHVQVHRYRDRIAVYLGDRGRTHYLTPDDAQQLVDALNAVITDIAQRPGTHSQFPTFSMDAVDDI